MMSSTRAKLERIHWLVSVDGDPCRRPLTRNFPLKVKAGEYFKYLDDVSSCETLYAGL
jgi:hypothetical protein